MKLLDTVLLFSVFPLIHAQYDNGSPTTTATSPITTSTSASSGVHTVDIGEDGITFAPASLIVSPGEKVEFHFNPQKHSVAQASFDSPCHPLSDMAFSSGLVSTSGESKTVFTLMVNDTNPIWYYCGQQGHCQAGMVGVINPPSTNGQTLASFKDAASKAKDTTVPPNVQGGVLANSNNESGSNTTTGSPSRTSGSASTSANVANTVDAVGGISVLWILSSLASMFMV